MAFDYNGDPSLGYDENQFNEWYGQQYGGARPNEVLRQQIGSQIGTPGGPNGRYNAQQWAQAQQLAQQGQQPFFPEFEAPKYDMGPAYQAPEAFKAPSMDQALQDPGYQMSLQQGLGAMQGSQAARGLARTGGAMKGLIDYGQKAAEQQYGSVYNRAAQQYQQNYQMGRDAWAANQQQREGAFDRNYRGASDTFNAKFRGRELSFADLYNRWNTNVNTQTQLALAD